MRLKLRKKRGNVTRFEIDNEKDMISVFFFRSLELLRLMSTHDGELLTAIIKKAGLEFGIEERSARDHVNRVLEYRFFSLEQNGKIYKNNKLFDWLLFHLLQLFPKRERDIVRWMLFTNSKIIDASMIARSKVYTQRIEDALHQYFTLDLGKEIVNDLGTVLWDIYQNELIGKFPFRTYSLIINNETEAIAMLFKKPLGVLRMLFDRNTNQKTSLIKEVSNEFGITASTANRHINKTVESGMVTFDENKNIKKNSYMIKWLWSYILPLYPKQEREALETMLLGVGTKFTSFQLELKREKKWKFTRKKRTQKEDKRASNRLTVKKYTQRIEDVFRERLKYDVIEKNMEKIVALIWNVFNSEKIKIDLL